MSTMALATKKKKKSSLMNRVLHWTTPLLISACFLVFLALLAIFAPSPNPPPKNRYNVFEQIRSRFSPGFQVPPVGGCGGRDLWSSIDSKLFSGCSNADPDFLKANVKTQPDRYLLIATSGGLNQQRTGIIDAVVVAYLLNATLVVPMLDHASFWHDKSNFSEIFDVDQFISFLRNDVRVIKQLPGNIGGKVVAPFHMRVPRKCNAKCYEDRVLPLLVRKHAVMLTKFDYRLSNRLDEDLQKLRCRVNYHALQFTHSIQRLGNLLVERMRMKSKHYIALHLRFEPDMLAFSGCYYGGGEQEREELGQIRKRWKNLHASNPEKVRRHGRCPLTPEEVGLMLRALGYGSDVHLYVASGEIYGGEATLAPLRALFPNFHTKETIASKEELAPYLTFSSRMAALDFIVCDESDVFVTNNNGNMAKILAGRRRYMGHKPTIRPNAKKLNQLLVKKDNMTFEEFAARVRSSQVGFMGEPNELMPGRGEFHENPSACICSSENGNGGGGIVSNHPELYEHRDTLLLAEENNSIGKEEEEEIMMREEYQLSEEEQEWPAVDYLDETSLSDQQIQLLEGITSTSIDYDPSLPLQTEVQEFFSD